MVSVQSGQETLPLKLEEVSYILAQFWVKTCFSVKVRSGGFLGPGIGVKGVFSNCLIDG